MLASTLLVKKREGHGLTDEEIRFLINGYCSGEVTDYQMSAFAMAVCLRGMEPREIATLTQAMLESGDRLPRAPSSDRPRVDKHSTGGLGDKVSLILAPLLAACDVQVPMISGRGLGLTGGTLDKLESIEGFRTDLSTTESSRVLNDAGAFIIGASEAIAPADRKLYALRDVTGTVESIALITASILSKKLAANLDALVMDVKSGSGAFMKTPQRAHELAMSLVRVGLQAGLPTSAIITDMDQPLGRTIGNAIEVNESIEILQGKNNSTENSPNRGGDVRQLAIELSANLLVQVGIAEDLSMARNRLCNAIDSGQAMERFEKMIHMQGGTLNSPLPLAKAQEIRAKHDGFLARFDCNAIGEAVIAMGGGRRKKGDPIDHKVGIRVHGRVGDKVNRGDPILTVRCHNKSATDYLRMLDSAVRIEESPVDPNPIILARIDSKPDR